MGSTYSSRFHHPGEACQSTIPADMKVQVGDRLANLITPAAVLIFDVKESERKGGKSG